MERIEMVEKICEKANVTMEEARAALERNNWDLLDAMVELEREGKIGKETGAGARASSGGADCQNYEQVNPTASRGESRKSGKGTLQKIWDKLVDLLNKSLSNSFVVSKDENVLVRVPVLVLVLLVLAAFWLTAIVLIVGLFFNLRYSFQGKELGKDSINSTIGKATDFAQELVREMKDEQEEGSVDDSRQ